MTHVKFGNIVIELDRLLNESQIIAKRGDKVVLRQKAPLDFLDLILRRKSVIPSILSPKTRELYRKLHKMSGKNLDTLDKKIILIDNPMMALERLNLLKGSQLAGNNSKKLQSDIDFIETYLDKL